MSINVCRPRGGLLHGRCYDLLGLGAIRSGAGVDGDS